MKKEIRVGDEGTVFELTIYGDDGVEDISLATVKNIIFRPPSGTPIVKPGAFTTDGTDGKLQYTAEAGFLTEEGILRAQAQIELVAGKWKSTIYKRWEVFPNLN